MLNWLYGPVLAAKADRMGTYAAALAYCFVLSLIPFLVVTFTLGTELTHQNLTRAYGELLVDILPWESAATPLAGAETAAPETAQAKKRDRDIRVERIIKTLEYSSHRHWALVGFILAAWTSFNLMTQIVRTLLFIFDDHRRPQDWSAALVLKTLSLFVIWMLVLLVFAICSIATPVHGPLLEQMHLNPALWKRPLDWIRDLIGMASLFGAFFLTFLLVPTKRYRLSQIRNGSFVAACGWALGSWIFAHVLPALWKSNVVFEALGSIVVILLWAQACAWSVIIGACWMVRFPGGRKKKGPSR